MRVILTPKAEADIVAEVEYLHSHGASSLRFLEAVEDAVAHLERYPETAVKRPDLTRHDVPFWLVNPYWMIVKQRGDDLYVVSVAHCSRKVSRALRGRLEDVR